MDNNKSKRSSFLDLKKYNSDKIENNLLPYYDLELEGYLDKEIKILELGVLKGGSVNLWHDYFPKGKIVGIDLELPQNFQDKDRIRLFKGSQADINFLSDVAQKNAPEGFDIIIDDASHIGELTKIGFWHLFENHLKQGGLYVIEDWGTGYFEDWPDGKAYDFKEGNKKDFNSNSIVSRILQKLGYLKTYKEPTPLESHTYGMVGFVKQLIDEQAAECVTRRTLKGKATRKSKFLSMHITPPAIFIRK